jgi:hypothetical protein
MSATHGYVPATTYLANGGRYAGAYVWGRNRKGVRRACKALIRKGLAGGHGCPCEVYARGNRATGEVNGAKNVHFTLGWA